MRHILIAIFALAVAADISGQWKGEFGGQNGTREIVFQFKADGDWSTDVTARRVS